jgi:hypothetical protein
MSHSLFASPHGEREKPWRANVITKCTFSHDADHDFTSRDFTVSIDQDYVTLFIYSQGQDFDRGAAGKTRYGRSQSFALTTSPPKPRTGNIKRTTKKYYFGAKRLPSEQKCTRSMALPIGSQC